MTDFSFIKLFTDFATAKRNDDPNIATIKYDGFILQKPNEVFTQITNSATDINFVGAIQVDLIDSCGAVVQNIDSNFFYEGVQDSNGIYQIAFSFGNIGVDYYSKLLYLKITDTVNDNIWYSNSFLVTNYKSDISTRFDYFNQTKLYGISYDLLPYTQSIRLANCYDNTPANKREVKQYVQSNGKQVNYRSITTFLRSYNINNIDYSINDRLECLFSHQIVYCNLDRVNVSEYSIEERKGDTNFLSGKFIINPQGERFTNTNQLYEGLEVLTLYPENESFLSAVTGTTAIITFNHILTSTNATVKLYKNGLLFETVEPILMSNELRCEFTNDILIGEYQIIIIGNIQSGGDVWTQTENWTFTIADGEFESTEYSNEYLTN